MSRAICFTGRSDASSRKRIALAQVRVWGFSGRGNVTSPSHPCVINGLYLPMSIRRMRRKEPPSQGT
ncbi:hypothetical protein T261_0723 [Streptomyces lydicus]|nr:hypothetical protein T261_0723 [Streptomyces lydicus]